MSVFQGYDGTLRIFSSDTAHPAAASYYLEVLFCDMDFTGPTSRGKTEEQLILNRGTFDSNSHYIEGSEHIIYAPMSLSFSCRLADTTNTQALCDWLSGVTQDIGGLATIHGWQWNSTAGTGGTTMGGVLVPEFEDTSKSRYRLEVLWNGTSNLGYQYEEVFFKPGDVNVTESEDSVGISVTGEIYGDVSRITAFTSATDITA